MTTTSIAMLIIVGASIGFVLFCCVMHLVDSYRKKNRKMNIVR